MVERRQFIAESSSDSSSSEEEVEEIEKNLRINKRRERRKWKDRDWYMSYFNGRINVETPRFIEIPDYFTDTVSTVSSQLSEH